MIIADMGVGSSTENLTDVEVNIGVIGSTKQGMSSLVNALRELGNMDPRATRGMFENESAMDDVRHFTHRRFKFISLWDVPGMNSANKKDYENFITNRRKVHYDLFIVVFKDVLNNVVTIDSARLAKKLNANILFVRTHFDIALNDEKRTKAVRSLSVEEIEQLKEDVIKKIRETGKTELQSEIPNEDVYLVDTGDLEQYDLGRLYEDFLKKSVHCLVTRKYEQLLRFDHPYFWMGLGKSSKIFEAQVDLYTTYWVIKYLNAFDLTRRQLQSLEDIRLEDREKLSKIISDTLSGNGLIYKVWNTEADVEVGGRERVMTTFFTLAVIGFGATAFAVVKLDDKMWVRWIGAATTAAVTFVSTATVCSNNCRKILKDARDVAKEAADKRASFVYDPEAYE